MKTILAGVRFMAYWNGIVITKYRSMLIMHRLSMDAVHSRTSRDVHVSQMACPNTQRPITSYTVANGMSRTATRRSDTAKDTIRRFDGVRSLRTIPTAVQMSRLPSIVPTMITPQMVLINAACHSTCEDNVMVLPVLDADPFLFSSAQPEVPLLVWASVTVDATRRSADPTPDVDPAAIWCSKFRYCLYLPEFRLTKILLQLFVIIMRVWCYLSQLSFESALRHHV